MSDVFKLAFSFTPIHVGGEAEVFTAEDARLLLLASATVEGTKVSQAERCCSWSWLTYFWWNIESFSFYSSRKLPSRMGSPWSTLTLTLLSFLWLQVKSKQSWWENKFIHYFTTHPQLQLTSKGIASVWDTSMLRHTTAIIAMRQNLITLDIVPGKDKVCLLFSFSYFSIYSSFYSFFFFVTKSVATIKHDAWSITITRRLDFEHWLYWEFFHWLYTLIEKSERTEEKKWTKNIMRRKIEFFEKGKKKES